MPAVVRLGDVCSGHGSFPSRPNISASPNVRINRKGAHRVGDAWAVHCDPTSCHGGVEATGSGTVRVNGKPLARVGDQVDCGSTCAQGSPNVFAG
ncbi:PAAR domain-containing protein [Stutzerimonas nitrititolerans]|uniref:PAAR domain-containing protein n=1 Tax=Stutzerimonas nitrititolerans TaxID=2482751 RepID=UPI0028A80B23|nr:PAAR domain-containing protein [Stutzerimonas nitrititolerans]